MKRLYTSNYARNGKHPLAISISVVAPPWFEGEMLPILAPTWEIVEQYKHRPLLERGYTVKYLKLLQLQKEREYTVEYLKLLQSRNIDVQQLVESLPNGAILLCYESPNDFCHRHIARNWLQDRCENVIIKEQLKIYKDTPNET
jgi:uncharacterized protein YeaO (DUF488 family)